jgi:hypothetical protein
VYPESHGQSWKTNFCGQNTKRFNVKVSVRTVVRLNGESSHCRYSVHVCTLICCYLWLTVMGGGGRGVRTELK